MKKVLFSLCYILFFLSCTSYDGKKSEPNDANKLLYLKLISLIGNNEVDSLKKYVVNLHDSDTVYTNLLMNSAIDIVTKSDKKLILLDSIDIIDSVFYPADSSKVYRYQMNFYDIKYSYLGKIKMDFHSVHNSRVLNIFPEKKVTTTDIDWEEFDKEVENELNKSD